MEHKGRVLGPSIERAYTLIFLLLELGAPRDAELGAEDPKLPAEHRVLVCRHARAGHVELEAGVVEPEGLPDRFDVRLFEREEHAEPFELDFVWVVANVGHLAWCELDFFFFFFLVLFFFLLVGMDKISNCS